MSTKLYIANLSYNVTESDLRTAFESFGAITDIFIATDRETARPRGFAFVTYDTAEAAQAAIAKMGGFELDGRALTVSVGSTAGCASQARCPSAPTVVLCSSFHWLPVPISPSRSS